METNYNNEWPRLCIERTDINQFPLRIALPGLTMRGLKELLDAWCPGLPDPPSSLILDHCINPQNGAAVANLLFMLYGRNHPFRFWGFSDSPSGSPVWYIH